MNKYQLLQTDIIKRVWQTGGKISYESDSQGLMVELAERSPIIIQNSSNPSSRKILDVWLYDRPYKVLLLAYAANYTKGTIL